MDSKLKNLDYWRAREAIMMAAQTNDAYSLEKLKSIYPHIFNNVMNQARNAKRRTHGN